ncbi:hypothetical protein D3C86_1904900 [compost metagenome]
MSKEVARGCFDRKSGKVNKNRASEGIKFFDAYRSLQRFMNLKEKRCLPALTSAKKQHTSPIYSLALQINYKFSSTCEDTNVGLKRVEPMHH